MKQTVNRDNEQDEAMNVLEQLEESSYEEMLQDRMANDWWDGYEL